MQCIHRPLLNVYVVTRNQHEVQLLRRDQLLGPGCGRQLRYVRYCPAPCAACQQSGQARRGETGPATRYPARNVFRVTAQRYIADMDMDSGLTRYLADDDGAVRLNGRPLFTFSDRKKPWLFEGCTNNSTWPSSVPAALTAAPSAYGDCRYRMSFKPDRITTHMDAGWTRFDPTYFTVPGRWVSPQGAPTWTRIIAMDANGKEVEAKPGTKLKVAAAEESPACPCLEPCVGVWGSPGMMR